MINVMYLNHPQTINPTSQFRKNCLPQIQSLVPKWLGTTDLEHMINCVKGPHSLIYLSAFTGRDVFTRSSTENTTHAVPTDNK